MGVRCEVGLVKRSVCMLAGDRSYALRSDLLSALRDATTRATSIFISFYIRFPILSFLLGDALLLVFTGYFASPYLLHIAWNERFSRSALYLP